MTSHQTKRSEGGDSSDGLRFPFETAPEIGTGRAIEVAPGVLWLRMPVGRELNAINVWTIADGAGWTIVDTGLRSEQTMSAWRAAMETSLSGRPIQSIVVTHMHPDHSGMAGWLAEHCHAPLLMTRPEYLMLRVMSTDAGGQAPAAAVDFYRSMGWDEIMLDGYRTRFGNFAKMLYPVPVCYRSIEHGDIVKTGDTAWEVLTGRGHSPEHACLYSSELKCLISGDEILPRISSNVSVHAIEPEADPMSQWLEGLARIAARVDAETLVLPAHGDPFLGVHDRIAALIRGHEQSLERVVEVLQKPKRVIDLFSVLFRREITPQLVFLATGEALANLHCLRSRGLAKREYDKQGVAWWSRA